MFPPSTPTTLANVTFTTEDTDDGARRIVVMTFTLAPFTTAQAEAVAVRSLLFASNGRPKEAIESAILHIDLPLQRLTFAMAPDQTETRIVFADVQVESQWKIKINQATEAVQASFKATMAYPTATDLLYLASGVGDTHYLTFEPEQGDLLTAVPADAPPRRRGMSAVDRGDELRPGVHAEH